MKPILRRSALTLCCVAAALQVWPSGRTNPPVTADLDAPADVRAILRRSCYDCHSNETRWPWYGRIAPVSWFLVRDVDSGRSELNFSEWGEYPEKKRRHKAEEILDEIRDGHMPPASYVRMHSSSAIAPDELETLRLWVESLAG